MKSVSKRSSTLVTLLFLFITFIFVIAFAPTQFGGPVTYVIVNGNSMEPRFHPGDLVLVRTESTYRAGDAVTYQNAEMGSFVFHRIVDTELDRFILKGDNNSWLDSYQPVQDEVIGKLWVHIPKLGKLVEWVRLPINMALAVALLAGVLMSGMVIKPIKNGRERNKPSNKFGGFQEGGLYLLVFLALIFLSLTIYSFIRPLTRSSATISYQQEGHFFYSATGTPGVYDTELVRSGEPVFPKLTCFLNLGFTYNLIADQLQGVSGSQQLYARVLDAQSGWQRTIPLIPQTGFSGGTYFTIATLDLCQVESLVTLMEQETGLHANTYTLEIVADVTVAGVIAGSPINDTFIPSLVFKFDKVHFYLASDNPQADPLLSLKQGLAGSAGLQTNTFSILGLNPTVRSIRVIALLGFGFSLMGLFAVSLRLYRTARQSQDALIRFKYGSMLVDVYEQNLAPSISVIDVSTIEDLARLAERQGTMILHMTQNFLHSYLVQSHGTTYRYVISTGRKGIADNIQVDDKAMPHTTNPFEKQIVEFAPVLAETINPKVVFEEMKAIDPPSLEDEPAPVVYVSENKTVNPKPAHKVTTEYVLDTGEIGFTWPQAETEILRKIKL